MPPRIRRLFRGFSVVTICAVTVPLAVFVCIVGGFIFLPLPATLPEPKPNLPSQATQVYDVDGGQIATLRRFEQNVQVAQADIPPVLKQAVISSEDRSFYEHGGVDPRGTFRALWSDLRNKSAVQGGSTITQQYTKLAYVGRERTVERKVREAVIASQLDRQEDKEKILFNYLSAIYLGDGTYGVGAASQSYFRKPVNQLNASESATLAGIIPAPSAWAPRDNTASADQRRRLVLDAMLGEGYLTQQQHDEAAAQTLWLDGQGEKPEGPVTTIYSEQKPEAKFPYFVDYVRRYLIAKYGPEKVFSGGLQVQTTLSPEAQAQAESAVNNTLQGTSAPLDMAMVSVEPPTGFVKSLVGGRDFSKAQVNLALGGCPSVPVGANKRPMPVQVQASCKSEPTVMGGGTGRQPGSSFKPFVLAAAYEQGITPGTRYPASATWSPPGCTGSTCVIGNYEDEVFGNVDLKDATAHSINTVYAPLIRNVGIKQDGRPVSGFIHTAEVAKKLGVTSAYYSEDFHRTGGNYALGVIDVSPLDMAASYGVFANRGMRQAPTPVVKVVDGRGNVLEDNTDRQANRVIDETVADNVNDALRSVVEDGTAKPNGQIGRPAAGKTGTTEEYSNAWFVGYTPTLSTSVWMGYSDRPRTINYKGNRKVAGGSVPTKVWSTYMGNVLKDVPVTDFSQPAPIRPPAENVFNSGGPTTAPPIRPGAQRRPVPTPTGDFDQVDGEPSSTPGSTSTTSSSTTTAARRPQSPG